MGRSHRDARQPRLDHQDRSQGDRQGIRTPRPIKIQRDENDWVMYRVEEKRFVGACGPLNLDETIKIFLKWFESPSV